MKRTETGRLAAIGMILILCIALAGCNTAVPESQDPSVIPEATASAAPEETEMIPEEPEKEEASEEPEKAAAFTMPGGESLIGGYETFEVVSENHNGGKWDDVISMTQKGENKSPRLSWEPVEGAGSYMIYMVDISTEYWMHWKSEGVTETALPLGWASESEYVGPYPPEGSTHVYEIFVIAVKKPVERLKGGLDSVNPKFPQFITALDTDAEGNTGNILSCGYIAGTFSR